MSGSDAANGAAATELDAGARLATVLLSVATSVGLLLVWQGVQHKWALFEAPPRLLLALTALTVVPVLVALLLHRGRERAPWIAGLLYLLLLAPLAWHTGCAVMPGISPNTLIYLCYWLALVAATFALPPLLQARRSHGSAFHYPALFEHACNNALSLAVAGVFVLACGLVLLLWQALFAVIGIHLFERLFQRAEFLYPAAGLAGGMGLVIGRSQLGAVRTALNICLMLGRALFPVVAALALLFLGTAVFSRFEALWQTRHASALLLVLLFAVVALYNAVHQDGLGSVVQGRPLRLLTQAALLVLPVYAGLAAYSLWLRVAQHGWTEERLWACLIDAVAALYAMAYAAAVLAARGGRLSLLDWANPRIAVAAVAVLLLTQSPLLDFRAIAVRAQVADALAPGHDPKLLDLNYLRFHAGRPGNEALQRLQGDPRVNAAMQTSIAAVLKQTYIYQSPAPAAGGIDAQAFRVLPAGTPLPASLLDAVRAPSHGDYGYGPRSEQLGWCVREPGSCTLLQVDLGVGEGPSWVEFDTCGVCNVRVYRAEGDGWVLAGFLRAPGPSVSLDLAKTWSEGRYRTETPPWKDLILGDDVRLRFEPRAADPATPPNKP